MSVANHWLFTPKQLEETPSRKSGISQADEDKHRRDGVQIIMEIGLHIGLYVFLNYFKRKFG